MKKKWIGAVLAGALLLAACGGSGIDYNEALPEECQGVTLDDLNSIGAVLSAQVATEEKSTSVRVAKNIWEDADHYGYSVAVDIWNLDPKFQQETLHRDTTYLEDNDGNPLYDFHPTLQHAICQTVVDLEEIFGVSNLLHSRSYPSELDAFFRQLEDSLLLTPLGGSETTLIMGFTTWAEANATDGSTHYVEVEVLHYGEGDLLVDGSRLAKRGTSWDELIASIRQQFTDYYGVFASKN